MPIECKKKVAYLKGVCTVEEAETLLMWLNDTPGGRINMKDCQYLHTAVLQVLLAARPLLSAQPQNEFLSRWVSTTLERENL
jgi:hypothetical protein